MKKWSKLVLATMLSVGTLSVSGCIENIEPEGIANLRGAKAELLRAQTALQAAQAAKVEAEAALVLAQVKVQEAIAKQEEAKAKYEEAIALRAQYEAEAQNITNESARAELQKKIAENELEIEAAIKMAELAAAQMAADMLLAEEAAFRAQLAVEEALRDLAVAKATLTPVEASAISNYEIAVEVARDAVELATLTLQEKSVALARAIAEIDGSGNSTFIKGKENQVRVSEAALEAAIKAEEKALALLELDKDAVDWDTQLQALKKEMDDILKEVSVLHNQFIEDNAAAIIAFENMDEDIENYENITGYELDYDPDADSPYLSGSGRFGIIQGVQSKTIPVPDVLIENEVLGDFIISSEEFNYGKEDVILDIFDKEIAEHNYKLNYYRYFLESSIDKVKEDVVKMEEDPLHLAAMERHADASEAVESGDYLEYFRNHIYTEENGFAPDFDLEEAIDDYNEALAAFEKGIADYEAEEVRLTMDQVRYEEIDAAETAEENEAEAVKARGYQDAESRYAAAYAVFQKADAAHDAALIKRDRAIDAAEKAADATEADMIAFEASYIEAAATEEEKLKHALYVVALENIKKARDAYNNPDPEVVTDPASVWEAAYNKWIEDQALYLYPGGSVYADIDAAYNDKMQDISVKYDAIWAEFYSNYPNFSTDYTNYWTSLLADLRDDLALAVNALKYPIIDVLLEDQSIYETVENSVNLYNYYGGHDGTFNLNVPSVPWFLFADGEFVSVTFDGLLDEDFFAQEILKNNADALWSKVNVQVYFNSGSFSSYTLDAEHYSGYPMTHMSYEEFYEYFKAVVGPDFDNMEYFYWTPSSMSLIEIYLSRIVYEISEDQCEEQLAAIPDHIEAIETAKAEFITYVEVVETVLDEFKADVETMLQQLIEDLRAHYDAYKELRVQASVLEVQYNNLEMIISEYVESVVSGTIPSTLEELEKALKSAYEAAVENRIKAEEALLEAEWALEELKAGNLNAVEIAQLEYDRAAEELAYAIAKLEKANAELQAIIAVIFEGSGDPGTGDDTPTA